MKFYVNVTPVGNQVYHRYIDNGKVREEWIDYQPRLFFKTSEDDSFKYRDHINGYPVKEIRYDDIYSYYNDVKKYNNIGSDGVYGDIAPQYQYIAEEYSNRIQYDISKLRVFYFDIETSYRKGIYPEDECDSKYAPFEIITISIYDSILKKYIILGTKDLQIDLNKKVDRPVKYIKCIDEKDLLKVFLKLWNYKDRCPDVIIGWNSLTFDLPYIHQRLKKRAPYLIKSLSPVSRVRTYERNYQVSETFSFPYLHVDIKGVEHLDYRELYKKYNFKPVIDNKLDTISNLELGSQKLHHEYFDLLELYEKDFDKFCHYNLIDVDLMVRLNDKLRFLEMSYNIAYRSGCNFEDTFKETKFLDSNFYRRLLRQNLIIPFNSVNSKERYKGGYVKQPPTGLSHNNVGFDLGSGYPNSNRELNIGHETKVSISNIPYRLRSIVYEKYDGDIEEFLEKECSLSPTGVYFYKGKSSMFSEVITEEYGERVECKRKMKEVDRKIEAMENELKRRQKGNKADK